MLTPKAFAIISQAGISISDIGYKIVNNINLGLNDSPKQDILWQRLIKAAQLYDTIFSKLIFTPNLDAILGVKYGIDTLDINVLLFCLKDICELGDLPAVNLPLRIYNTPLNGGSQGIPGPAGQSYYVYIRYATDNIGTGFSAVPSPSRRFISILTSSYPLPDVVTSHAGNWIEYIGVGQNGVDGNDGNDGVSSYLTQAWANDDQGNGFTLTFDGTKPYTSFVIRNDAVPPASTEFNGKWVRYIGINGADGADGKTILNGTIDPSTEGVDGDFYINTSTWYIFGPKTLGTWPSGQPIIGPAGLDGNDGQDGNDGLPGDSGVNAFIYIAYADDSNGTGYILVKSNDPASTLVPFDSSKKYIGIITSDSSLGGVISSVDFTGLWAKYQGEGDRYSTTSTTSLAITLGAKVLQIEKDLSYITGQRVVIALDGDPTNRMEGYVVNYDKSTGQMSYDATDIYGSGTYSVWDVGLQASVPNNTIYQGPSPTNITVGGMPAGTAIFGRTYDSLFEEILIDYLLPTFSAFTISGLASVLEVGDSIPASKTFNWSTTNSSNIATNSIDIIDVTNANTVLVNDTANDGTETHAGSTVTKILPSSHVFRITGVNTNAGSFQRDLTVPWQYRRFNGVSNNVVLTEAQIEALATSSLNAGITGTYSFAAGGYKYICYEETLGSPTAVTGFKDTLTNLPVSMADVSDDAAYSNVQNGWYYALVSVTNAFAITKNYRVYRTKNILGSSLNIAVS